MSVFSSRAVTKLRQAAREQELATHDKRRSAQRSIGQIPVTLLPWIVGLLVLVGWYLVTKSGRVSSLILPAPGSVFLSLKDGFSSGIYLKNTLVTVQESVFGFLLALVVALPLGYGLAKSRLLATTFQPYLAAGQA